MNDAKHIIKIFTLFKNVHKITVDPLNATGIVTEVMCYNLRVKNSFMCFLRITASVASNSHVSQRYRIPSGFASVCS